MPARTSAKFTVAVQLEVICWQASWLAGQLIGSPAGGHTLLHIAAPCLMYKRLQTSILVDLRWPRLAISSREFHILQNLTLNYYLSNNTSLQYSKCLICNLLDLVLGEALQNVLYAWQNLLIAPLIRKIKMEVHFPRKVRCSVGGGGLHSRVTHGSQPICTVLHRFQSVWTDFGIGTIWNALERYEPFSNALAPLGMIWSDMD